MSSKGKCLDSGLSSLKTIDLPSPASRYRCVAEDRTLDYRIETNSIRLILAEQEESQSQFSSKCVGIGIGIGIGIV